MRIKDKLLWGVGYMPSKRLLGCMKHHLCSPHSAAHGGVPITTNKQETSYTGRGGRREGLSPESVNTEDL